MKVQGTYYGNNFTGAVNTKLTPNRIVNLHVKLDKTINHCGTRRSLLFSNWENGKKYKWGSCWVTEE